MPTGFFDRLVARLDKLDPGSLQAQLVHLAQERGFLETIFQSIQEGVMVIGNSGTLAYANRAAEKLIGFDYARLRGKSIRRYLEDWDWEALIDTGAITEGDWSAVITREIEVTYPEHRFLSFYAQPITTHDLPRNHVLLMIRDVTRDHHREESTIESERLDAVKMLAAGVAHEIGNPLNALTIHLQLLQREIRQVSDLEARDALAELAGVAHAEVTRLDAIIRRFLQAVRPTHPDLKPGDLADVLKTTLRVLQPDLENRAITVSVELPGDLPAVRFDPQQMEQVFFNILKNAMEAVRDGGQIGISISADDAWVAFSFLDNGEGIDPERLGQIFEPYHTSKTRGTGLGLMIVQRIVQEHGGVVEAASRAGEGTCFTVRLPRAERRVRQLPTPEENSHE